MKVLYETSFSADLYQASGKELVGTFLSSGIRDKLYVCYEDDEVISDLKKAVGGSDLVDYYDLRKDEWMADWLKNNEDIIPEYLGGKMKECSCPGREKRHARHRPGCRYTWMNRQASKFFRKIVSWRKAASLGYGLLVWLDSDCHVYREVPHKVLRDVAGDCDVAYCRGTRPAPETGIVVFNLKRNGGKFIENLCSKFESGAFRKYERWDDGYMVGVVADEGGFLVKDLVDKARQRQVKTNNVIPLTVWRRYIKHKKGLHSSVLNIRW